MSITFQFFFIYNSDYYNICNNTFIMKYVLNININNNNNDNNYIVFIINLKSELI